MTTQISLEALSSILREAGPAHHKAFIHSNGADPDWPMWYAEYLYDKVQPYFSGKFTRSELVCLLIEMDKEQRTHTPGTDWASYYARFLQERYKLAQNQDRRSDGLP